MVLDKKVGGLDSLIFEIFLNLQELLGVFFLVLLFLHHFLLDADPANHGGVIAPQNPVEISFWQVLNEGGNGVVVNDLPFGLKGLGIHIEFLDLLDDLPEFGLVLLLNFLDLDEQLHVVEPDEVQDVDRTVKRRLLNNRRLLSHIVLNLLEVVIHVQLIQNVGEVRVVAQLYKFAQLVLLLPMDEAELLLLIENQTNPDLQRDVAQETHALDLLNICILLNLLQLLIDVFLNQITLNLILPTYHYFLVVLRVQNLLLCQNLLYSHQINKVFKLAELAKYVQTKTRAFLVIPSFVFHTQMHQQKNKFQVIQLSQLLEKQLILEFQH